MSEYQKGSHIIYDIKYHVVWVTKYRYQVLKGDIALRLRELIRQSCLSREITIIKGSVGKEHIHLLLGCPPQLAPSKIVQSQGAFIKDATRRIPASKKAILGSAPLGKRIFLCDGRYYYRRDDQGIHR